MHFVVTESLGRYASFIAFSLSFLLQSSRAIFFNANVSLVSLFLTIHAFPNLPTPRREVLEAAQNNDLVINYESEFNKQNKIY